MPAAPFRRAFIIITARKFASAPHQRASSSPSSRPSAAPYIGIRLRSRRGSMASGETVCWLSARCETSTRSDIERMVNRAALSSRFDVYFGEQAIHRPLNQITCTANRQKLRITDVVLVQKLPLLFSHRPPHINVYNLISFSRQNSIKERKHEPLSRRCTSPKIINNAYNKEASEIK